MSVSLLILTPIPASFNENVSGETFKDASNRITMFPSLSSPKPIFGIVRIRIVMGLSNFFHTAVPLNAGPNEQLFFNSMFCCVCNSCVVVVVGLDRGIVTSYAVPNTIQPKMIFTPLSLETETLKSFIVVFFIVGSIVLTNSPATGILRTSKFRRSLFSSFFVSYVKHHVFLDSLSEAILIVTLP